MLDIPTILQSILFQSSMPGGTPPFNPHGASSPGSTLPPSAVPSAGPVAPSRADVDAARRKLVELINGGPQMQDPVKPIMPAYRTEDAIKGGLGLLLSAALGGNQGAAGFAQAYTGQKQNLANMKTQYEQQKVDTANAEAMRKYNQMLTSAQTELGFKNEDYQQAWSEFDRERTKKEQKPTQANEQQVLADARAYAKNGGNARRYVFDLISRGELSMEVAGRILSAVNEDAFKSRHSTRSTAFNSGNDKFNELQARHMASAAGAVLGGLAPIQIPIKPVSKEELLRELDKLQKLRTQIEQDVKEWRSWNGLADGEKDEKLNAYAELLAQIGKRGSELLRMLGPLPKPRK